MLGSTWASRELDGYPDSVQGLQDAAVIDRALGRVAAADGRLRTAPDGWSQRTPCSAERIQGPRYDPAPAGAMET